MDTTAGTTHEAPKTDRIEDRNMYQSVSGNGQDVTPKCKAGDDPAM